MSKWLAMLKNNNTADYHPTEPTKRAKMTLVGFVGSNSEPIKKNKRSKWLSLLDAKNTFVGLVGSQSAGNEKITPKVWRLKIASHDKTTAYNITMIDPAGMSPEECQKHLINQFGEGRVISYE